MRIHSRADTVRRIERQLSARTGIVAARSHDDFERALERMLGVLRLDSLEELSARLSNGQCWDQLLAAVTVGETYFLREPLQFDFIRQVALPELHHRRNCGRPVRAWSAGCASGEEAYSLAIALHEDGLLDCAYVVGSDVCASALAKARAGRYREWAFRAVTEAFVARYFDGRAQERTLRAFIRERVTFVEHNLAAEEAPNMFSDMDLILCRNVLIYFGARTIERVARRLFAALSPGGWLITGPSDPVLSGYAPFMTLVRDCGVLYRRPARESEVGSDEARASPMAAIAQPRAELGAARSPSRAGVQAARSISSDGHVLENVETREAVEADALAHAIREVREAWRAGDSLGLLRACASAIERFPLSAELRYLYGVALLDADRLAEALSAVRQTLYLDPSLSIAQFTLGAILERMQDTQGAARAYRNVRDSVRTCGLDEPIPMSDGISARGLASAAARALRALQVPAEDD